jgi:hypothetical protein
MYCSYIQLGHRGHFIRPVTRGSLAERQCNPTQSCKRSMYRGTGPRTVSRTCGNKRPNSGEGAPLNRSMQWQEPLNSTPTWLRDHVNVTEFASLWLHEPPSVPSQAAGNPVVRKQRGIRVHELLAGLLRTDRQRLLVAGEVVEQAVRDDCEVVGQVQARGDYEEGEQEEEDRVWLAGVSCDSQAGRVVRGVVMDWVDVLNINFSVDVSMYSENVTSYWYRLRWNQRSSAAGYNMTPMSRNEAQARRQRVAKDVESIMNAWGGAGCVCLRGAVRCADVMCRTAQGQCSGTSWEACHFSAARAQGS